MKALLKVFGSYLWERRAMMLWLALCTAVFGLLCSLYGLPLTAVWYGAALCAVPAMICALIGFSRFYLRETALRRLKASALNDPALLPKPIGSIERNYNALLQRALDETARLTAEKQSDLRRQLDTFALWTHQIKVPISAMRLMLTDHADQRSVTLQAELFKIEQYTEMALNYARLNASATDYVIRYYDLDGILRQLLRKFAPLFIDKKLSLHYEPTDLKVLTDEKWLLFALEQVLSNAIKYTDTGSVALKCDKAAETLCIRDTGIGIAVEDLPRIFDQGYTGYNGRSDKRATGLGLFLCRQTLNRLGHTIHIESEIGKGTAVTISLKHSDVVHE